MHDIEQVVSLLVCKT